MATKKRARNTRSVKSKLKEISLDEMESDFPTTSKEVQSKGVGFRLDVKVNHQLTDKQKDILKRMTDYKTRMVLIDGLWGTSKAQPLDSKILTPSGWTTMGSISVGDFVIGSDGNPTQVLGVFPQGEKEIFKVTFSDDSSTECCLDHLWLTQTEYERNKQKRARNGGNPIYTKTPAPPQVRTLKEIQESILVSKDHLNHSIPITQPVNFEPVQHYIDPYILGVLLGDGCLRNQVSFTTIDSEIHEKVRALLPEKLSLVHRIENITYAIVYKKGHKSPIKEELRRLKLLNHLSFEKFIPDEYKFDSTENRIKLLHGLMDTDGTTDGTYTSFCTTSDKLRDDVKFIVQSLGGTSSHKTHRQNTYTYKGEKKLGRVSYIVSIKLPNNICPFMLERKRIKLIPRTKYFPIRYFKKIESVGYKHAQCILVDAPNHLYLTDDCIVTHNTFISVLSALTLMSTGSINKIYYVRSPVESSDTAKIGTLPGDLAEKTGAYMAVMEEKLAEFLPYNQVNRLIQDQYVEFLPPGFMRGRSLDNSVLICDEASNFSWKDMLLISSRLGVNSRMFVIGDSFQNDIGNKSGFERFFNLFQNDEESKTNGIHTFTMKNKEDILRSGFIRFVMEKAGVLTFGR